jgi:hypothetical protein
MINVKEHHNIGYTDEEKQNKNTWWTPHHRVHRTKKTKTKTRGGYHTIGYTGRRKTKQKHVVDTTNNVSKT